MSYLLPAVASGQPTLNTIHHCDALTLLKALPAGSADCVVTSPPYYALRSYLDDDDPNKSVEIGLEDTPAQFIERLMQVFREVHRVLKPTGVCFVNLGDSYASSQQRAMSYDNSDTQPQGYLANDCICENLCDACQTAYLNRTTHNDNLPVAISTASGGASNLAHKSPLPVHASSGDSIPPVDHSASTSPGFEQTANHADGQPLASQESTPGVSSQPLQDGYLPVSNDVSAPSKSDSSSGYAQVSADKSGVSSNSSGYTQDSASPSEEQQRHSRYTSGYCSRCGTYSNHLRTYIQPHCTIERKSYQSEKPLPAKSLMMIPARFAIAMQDEGWILRSEIVWAKRAPMPESVTDRPTKAHEMIYLFAKEGRYFYDQEAVREKYARPYKDGPGYGGFANRKNTKYAGVGNFAQGADSKVNTDGTRNLRDVWHLSPEPTSAEHFAAYPTEIPRRCILAGCPEQVCAECGKPYEPELKRSNLTRTIPNGYRPDELKMHGVNRRAGEGIIERAGLQPTCKCNAGTKPGVVLDMFTGTGTTLLVARKLNRSYIGCDLNPDYVEMSRKRLRESDPFQDRTLSNGSKQLSLFAGMTV